MSLKNRLFKRGLATLLSREMGALPVARSMDNEGEVCPFDLSRRLDEVMARHTLCKNRLNGSVELRARVAVLQEWQKSRVARTYHRFLHHKALGQATRFVLEEAYAGPEHDALIAEIERVAPYLVRIFPVPLVQIACDILMLNVITQELDIALGEAWTAERLPWEDACELTVSAYEDLFCTVGQFDRRREQLGLIRKLGDSIECYLGSQWIYAAFKVAQFPAKALGLTQLVDFMDSGFMAIHALPIPGSDLVSIIAESEMGYLERLSCGERGVLGQSVCAETDQACDALMSRATRQALSDEAHQSSSRKINVA